MYLNYYTGVLSCQFVNLIFPPFGFEKMNRIKMLKMFNIKALLSFFLLFQQLNGPSILFVGCAYDVMLARLINGKVLSAGYAI